MEFDYRTAWLTLSSWGRKSPYTHFFKPRLKRQDRECLKGWAQFTQPSLLRSFWTYEKERHLIYKCKCLKWKYFSSTSRIYLKVNKAQENSSSSSHDTVSEGSREVLPFQHLLLKCRTPLVAIFLRTISQLSYPISHTVKSQPLVRVQMAKLRTQGKEEW